MNAIRCAAASLFMLLASAAALHAQDNPDAVPLYEQEPFDQITVDETNGGGTYRVLPLDLPGRKLPKQPALNDLIDVRMLDDRDTQAQIAWKHIAKVELFEQLLLAEARRLTEKQEFEAAYDCLAALHENFPQFDGLAEATRDFRYRNAAFLFRQQRWAEALALLEEVFREEPQRSGLAAALANVSQPMFETFLHAEDYDAAHALLTRTAQRGDASSLELSRTWQAKLEAEALGQQQQAREHSAAQRFRQANDAARRMLALWADVPGGRELSAEISLRWPIVRVGVQQLRPTLELRYPLEHVAARTAALTGRPLVVLSRFGPDGPEYASPYGEISLADNRRELSLRTTKLSGYDAVALLLERCDPQSPKFDPLWAPLVKSVEVVDVYQTRIALARPYPQPLAILQDIAPERSPLGVYVATPGDGRTSYVADATMQQLPAAGPREVIELLYASPDEALADLRHGRIDVVSQLAPQNIDELNGNDEIRVARFAVPNIHLLVPNGRRAFPANSTFRRAIAYGIPRGQILRDELLGEKSSAGSRTLSGPFPSGDAQASWSYGSDDAIEPLAYEPRMSLTLLRVAEEEVARAAQRGTAAVKRTPLVIGHGENWLHRRACVSIAEQLTRIGIDCQTRQFIDDDEDWRNCDFWYVELAIHEPLVDAVRLLGRGGMIEPSPYVALAVRDVMNATTADEASQRLHALHAVVHAEQAVIPLWQIADHFAYRRNLAEFAGEPATLYRHIDHWRVVGEAAAVREP